MMNFISEPSYTFVHLKGFGDLTVTASCIRHLPEHILQRVSVLIGPHLTELATTLDLRCAVQTLTIESEQLPALFDIRRQGPIAGLTSALDLRRAIAILDRYSTFVVPYKGLRHNFITGQHPTIALPQADNIYSAHQIFSLQEFGHRPHHNLLIKSKNELRRIALCPFSRNESKNLPPQFVAVAAQICREFDFDIDILLLEGEKYQSIKYSKHKDISRSFECLASTLAMYDGVISADSLPAHLAEYYDIPTFVVSKEPNPYWLPAHAFMNDFYGLFSGTASTRLRLERFLDAILHGRRSNFEHLLNHSHIKQPAPS